MAPINRANIVLIPKKEVAEEVGDYRPISIINIFPKLISKVLSNRLRNHLPRLISSKQTAFIKDRHIAESFIATREMLSHIQTGKSEAIFAKIDFSKAFDSIQWSFLTKVMMARGFPIRWIRWIQIILSTSSSRILMNGDQTDYFAHKRGLRQGDPLSPMLFIIAVDVLQMFIQGANATLRDPISTRIRDSIVALQYADDTAIVAKGDIQTIITLKIILKLFAKVSGLEINYGKSAFVPINLPADKQEMIQAILGCQRTELPVMYLGMPLTLRKPGRHLFIPLIEKLEQRLQGWKKKLISRGAASAS